MKTMWQLFMTTSSNVDGVVAFLLSGWSQAV